MWNAGDKAVCIDLCPESWREVYGIVTPQRGQVYTVIKVRYHGHLIGLILEGVDNYSLRNPSLVVGWDSVHFRKVVKDEGKECSEEFKKLLNKKKVNEPA